MKSITFLSLTLAGLLAGESQGVVINDAYFTASGGTWGDVAGTLDAGYSDARNASFEDQFLAVGTFGQCTGTWIGNDVASNKSYFLTAAHCYSTWWTSAPVSDSFKAWTGATVASGTGTFYIPPERVNRPEGWGGAGTDIGILELPGITTINDAGGQPIVAPLIYDGDQEFGNEVNFVGYGSWGIGSFGSNGSYHPSSGPRRARGTNIISSVNADTPGMSANFDTQASGNATLYESSTASGDSGSAWWQQHNGRWTIIGTTNGGSGTTFGTFSTAPRSSWYTDWIRSIYPEARFYSENLADITLDGNVDQLDIDEFIANWRATDTPENPNLADLNDNGIVDLADAGILRDGLVAAGASATLDLAALLAVPEPSTLTLLSIGGALALLRRRR